MSISRLAFIAATASLILVTPAGAQTPAQAPVGGIFSRTGTIVLKVPSFVTAWSLVTDAARMRGGKLIRSTTRTDDKGRKYGSVVYELPVDQIPSMYGAAGAIGKLYGQKFEAVDNQSDYESLARRASSLHRHEDRLAGILASPRHMRGGDILFLQERLFRADVDAEMLMQQRDDLMRGTQSGTLKIELFEPNTMPIPDSTAKIDLAGWYRFGLLRARHEFERSMARAATGGAYAMVYAPIWMPLLVTALLLLWALWRLRRRIWNVVVGLISRLIRVVAAVATRLQTKALAITTSRKESSNE